MVLGGQLTDDGRTAGAPFALVQATAAAARATDHVLTAAGSDPRTAADAAWAAADFLAAAARVVEGRRGGPLTAASGEYERGARELWGRIPEPSKAGQGLRTASVPLATAGFVARNENKQLLALLAQLSALTDAVTGSEKTSTAPHKPPPPAAPSNSSSSPAHSAPACGPDRPQPPQPVHSRAPASTSAAPARGPNRGSGAAARRAGRAPRLPVAEWGPTDRF
jgi:hypothetical protein